MTDHDYIVLGAGGHARVVIDALRSSGAAILGCLDPKAALRGKILDGITVLGGDEVLEQHPPHSVLLANGVGAAAATIARRTLFTQLSSRGYRFPPVKSAAAYCSDSARLSAGCQLMTRSVVHPGADIGENTVVNTAAVVEHDCSVGAHCFIGPGAVLCGGARLAEGVFVGTGAVILPCIEVGPGSHIGAGAIVSKNVPAGGKARGAATRILTEARP